jgi:molybdopterin-containing oxidoreductase family membrane subunit
MTIFAVMCAGIFPAFHVGRVWFAWFLAPIPNANAIWQNFKSPLLWDVFAVSTYFTVSLIFWFLGMVPDLATIRDRCKPGIRKILYGIFALGWRGGNRQWSHYEMAYLLLAARSTSRPQWFLDGTPRFSLLTSSQARSSVDSLWCLRS